MKMPMTLAAIIPPITVVPMIWRETAPAPVAIHSGTHPRMNANDVIRIGRRRSRAPSSAASVKRLPFLEFVLREFDDQDRVLRRQPDEHHQTDLRVDIVLDLDHVGRQKISQQRHGAATARRRRRTPRPAC